MIENPDDPLPEVDTPDSLEDFLREVRAFLAE